MKTKAIDILEKLINTGEIYLTKSDVVDMALNDKNSKVEKYAYARQRLRDEQLQKAPQALQSLKEALLEEIAKTKADTYLLGCNKHWSDDSSGTCTCDENESAANRFYEEAKEDMTKAINQFFSGSGEL